MAEKKPWMPLYRGDWLGGTSGMPLAVRAIYLDLILHQWDEGGVPNDLDELAGIARCGVDDLRAAWERLTAKGKFVLGDDGLWRNPRVEDERRRAGHQKTAGAVRAAGAQRGPNGRFGPAVVQPEVQPVLVQQPSSRTASGHPASQSQSQSHTRERATLIARRDPSAAFQAPTFRVPGGWERDTLARANGRLTRTDLLAFYADFQRFVETEQPDLTGDRLFRVLDRELGHWRERRDVDAEMQAGRDTVRKLREFEANFKAKQAGGAA